ncbi:uncharacterized protein FIESC28_03495 [Fusarium coffeatum]|uniref:Uncharacterized protein n=1 Tax=Fusarium coffeatum TaxID=231269 RepID=A0A366S314_9HYPO|nr:uncharacterized protein FIESC28_03495 [Fusarium coffeatum]RBR23699.1 hypothetical protein FIESC28_03495 [Fusarium coffeatum]
MSSLPDRFYIILNGLHIVKPDHDPDKRRTASVGGVFLITPTIFELQGDRLISGDRALGRFPAERPGMGPQVLVWFRKEDAHSSHPLLVKARDSKPESRFTVSPLDREGCPMSLCDDQVACWTENETALEVNVEIVPVDE